MKRWLALLALLALCGCKLPQERYDWQPDLLTLHGHDNKPINGPTKWAK